MSGAQIKVTSGWLSLVLGVGTVGGAILSLQHDRDEAYSRIRLIEARVDTLEREVRELRKRRAE